MQKRILLHAMTFFRDFGTLYVLSKLLEKMGCKCFIASNSEYVSRWIKIWNPHAVVYVTGSRSQILMKHYPRAKFFHLSGEGAQDYDHCDELIIIKNKNCFPNIEKMYIWGENTLDNIKKYLTTVGHAKVSGRSLEHIYEKIEMIGHPRLDLIRFRSKTDIKKEKINIGFIGNSHSVNVLKKGTHPITRLLDRILSLKTIDYSFNLLKLYLDIMDELGHERFSYSLRPYPLEPIEAYNDAILVKNKKLKIDRSLDFSTWVNENDIIIGDLTEAFTPVIVSKRLYLGVINLIPGYSDEHVSPVISKVKHLLKDHCPKSISELKAICMNYKKYKTYSSELKDYMHYLFNTKKSNSVLATVACSIVETLGKAQQNIGPGAPPWLLQAISSWRYRSVISYSSINREMVRRRTSIEFDPVVANIFAGQNSHTFFYPS